MPALSEIGPDIPAERWRLITGLFVKMFFGEVGAERESFVASIHFCYLLHENIVYDMFTQQTDC